MSLKFVVTCPYCQKKLQAYTRTVLEHVVRQHTPKCYAAARARTAEKLAELAQLNLFNTQTARSK